MNTQHPTPDTQHPPLYLVGIGGAGMSALAWLWASRGQTVRGADPGISPAVRARLEAVGVTVFDRHDPAQIGDAVRVIATDAVPDDHVELAFARARGIEVVRRPAALAELVNEAATAICVAGTHGKTTTTGMVARILIEAEMNPTVLVGGDFSFLPGANARLGDPDLIVVEACEAYGGLDHLRPTIAVVTNVEPDHLDHHKTEDALIDAFARFLDNIRPGGKLVGPATPAAIFSPELLARIEFMATNDVSGDEAIAVFQLMQAEERKAEESALFEQALSRMATRAPEESLAVFTTVGGHARPNEVSMTADGSRFALWYEKGPAAAAKLADIVLRVPGGHNIDNAIGAYLAAVGAGATMEAAVAGLGAFDGAGRRFERLGEWGGALFIDDYAHHPTEISATLSAARAAFPGQRIVVAFQPHLPSRTRDFFANFAAALAGGADRILLTDIYLAREKPMPGVSSETLAAAVNEIRPDAARFVGPLSGVGDALREEIQPGDIVFLMGAGNIRDVWDGLDWKA